jgi:hypothetical protein
MRPRITSILLGIAAFLVCSWTVDAFAAPAAPIERFTAFAASLGTGRSDIIQIGITRWSTDEERQKLLTTLQEFGSDKLADELSKIRPPVGYIRRAGSVGYDLFYARNHPQPDGSRRIVLATNRPVSFREVSNNTRSMQYQVTVIEIHIGADGKGEGKMVPAAKIKWDNATKTIEIENYNALPVELLNVTTDKS